MPASYRHAARLVARVAVGAHPGRGKPRGSLGRSLNPLGVHRSKCTLRSTPPLRELGRMPPPAVTRLQHPWITPDDNQECTTRFTAASRQNAPEFSRTTPTFREEIRCEDGGVAGQYPPQNWNT